MHVSRSQAVLLSVAVLLAHVLAISLWIGRRRRLDPTRSDPRTRARISLPPRGSGKTTDLEVRSGTRDPVALVVQRYGIAVHLLEPGGEALRSGADLTPASPRGPGPIDRRRRSQR